MSITGCLQDFVEFGAVGPFDSAGVAGKFDHRHLEAETQAEIGHFVFASVADALDFALGAADAKAAGNDDSVTVGQFLGDIAGVNGCGVDPVEVDVDPQMHAAMLGGFDDGRVGIAKRRVFSGDGDGDLFPRLSDAVDKPSPVEAGLIFLGLIDAIVKVQEGQDFAIHPGVAQGLGNRVDAVDIVHGHDALHRHVGVHRNLFADFFLDGIRSAAGDDVGHDADFHQALDPELRGLRFLLAESPGFQHIGEHDEDNRVLPLFISQLAAGFEICLVLKVADGAADFDEDDVGIGFGGQFAQPQFHFAGDVGDELHIAAEVSAIALFLEHGREDLAVGREIRGGEVLIEEPFIGAQIHVGFHAVVEDENFAMAIGVEGPAVDVVVPLHLDRGDAQALVLQELGEGGREDSLPQPAHDGPDDDHVFMVALAVPFGHRRIKLRLLGRLPDLVK